MTTENHLQSMNLARSGAMPGSLAGHLGKQPAKSLTTIDTVHRDDRDKAALAAADMRATEESNGANAHTKAEATFPAALQWSASSQALAVGTDSHQALRFGGSQVAGGGITAAAVKVPGASGFNIEDAFRPVAVDTAIGAPTLNLATDSGASASDGLTNVNVVQVGNLVVGTSWEYQVDDGAWIKGGARLADITASSLKARLGGSWIPSGLNASSVDFQTVGSTKTVWLVSYDGTYTKGVKVEFSEDANGRLRAKPSAAGYVDGNHVADWSTQTRTGVALAGSASETGYGIEQLLVNGIAFGSGGYLGNSSFTALSDTFLITSTDGLAHTYKVRQNDLSGSSVTSSAAKFTLDAGIGKPVINTIAGDDRVNAAEKTAGVTINGTAEARANLSVQWGGTTKTVTAQADGKWTATFVGTELPGDGSTKVTAQATDLAGNVSEAGTKTVLVDTMLAIPTLGLATDSGHDNSDGITNVKTIKVGGLEAGATWKYTLDGVDGRWRDGVGDSFDLPAEWRDVYDPADSMAIRVKQVDAAGNSSISGSRSVGWRFDTIAPNAPSTRLAKDSGSSESDQLTNQKYVNVTGLERNADWQYRVDGGAWKNGVVNHVLGELKDTQVRATLNGRDIGADLSAKAVHWTRLSADVATMWMVAFDSVRTKGVKIELLQGGDGVIKARILEAGYRFGDHVEDFASAGYTPWTVADGDKASGYGVKNLAFNGLTVHDGYLDKSRTSSLFSRGFEIESADGKSHTYDVRQIDVAGNTSGVASAVYALDTTGPAALGLSLVSTPPIGRFTGAADVASEFKVTGIPSGGQWEYSTDGGLNWSPGVGDRFRATKKMSVMNAGFEDGYRFFSTNYDLAGFYPGAINIINEYRDGDRVFTGRNGTSDNKNNFLWVDSGDRGGFWGQTFWLESGHVYTFSYYRRITEHSYSTTAPTIHLRANWAGTPGGDWRDVGAIDWVDKNRDTEGWVLTTNTFTAISTGNTRLHLVSGKSGRTGNDVAIDDIALYEQTFAAGQNLVRHFDSAGNATITEGSAVTPIALDLDASGQIETIRLADSTGRFDLLNNGQPLHSAWIGKGDAWLAVDSNGNGVIDDRHELFGGDGPRDAFLKLARYDGNGDGLVDANDPRFLELLVWRDANGDHQSQPDELIGLQNAGVKNLKVKADIDRWFEDAQGVTHGDTATATLINGKEVTLTDLWLPVEAADGVAPPNLIPSNAAYESLHPYATPLAVLA